MEEEISIKCVIVGDSKVGKTSILMSYGEDTMPDGHIPTVFENYTVAVKVDDQVVSLSLWDTAPHEEYDRLRPLSYPGTDVFIICYSVTDSKSFKNVMDKWVPEIKKNCSPTPIVLVGNKIDADKDKSNMHESISNTRSSNTMESCCDVLDQNDISSIITTSAATKENLDHLFETVIKVAIKHKYKSEEPNKKKKRCIIF
ncbi:unnamed protein product [Moneuplotes crassus]|uniref:Rho family GTPase n=1 Tax=Euplotes crassus TaxID=5936 RepID=A0AAD1XZ49_EUPCR|nr:unnamed protein product [Moneuplotes crassus]